MNTINMANTQKFREELIRKKQLREAQDQKDSIIIQKEFKDLLEK